jgi:N-acetylneuraminate synthase
MTGLRRKLMDHTYIIAEAGVNHNGSLESAMALLYQAKAIGADAIKFQIFSAEKLTTRYARQADYQQKAYTSASQYDMLKALELSQDSFSDLKNEADSLKIDFIVTPFDLESLDFISQILDLPVIKLGSADITNGPLLLKAAHSKRKIILSTGMSTLGEIEDALKVIAFGLTYAKDLPTSATLNACYASFEVQKLLQQTVTLLHCTSEYPAPIEEMNLDAMHTLGAAFGLPVGLSDHSKGIVVPIAAVAKKACMIEKHFTLDNNLPGPDHQASLNVQDFKSMIQAIREVEKAMGHGLKIPSMSEAKNKNFVRRSLVASHTIKRGELYTTQNIGIKRPVNGLSPMFYWEKIGKVAEKDYEKDEMIL